MKSKPSVSKTFNSYDLMYKDIFTSTLYFMGLYPAFNGLLIAVTDE